MSSASDILFSSDLAGLFSAQTRLYSLEGDAEVASLMVERWQSREALSALSSTSITLLSTRAGLAMDQWIGRPVTLCTRLATGERLPRTGLVNQAEMLSADGGLARYRISVVPWLWYLTVGRHNRVFQEKSVCEILERVFADYGSIAAWDWAEDVQPFLSDVRPRSYCVQYEESDYDFVARLLAEEGLGYCFEEDESAPAGHRLQLFADSFSLPEDPISSSPVGGEGIRFHRAASVEQQDAIQSLEAHCRFQASAFSTTSFDFKTKTATSAQRAFGTHSSGPALECYDYAGAYAYADTGEADRYAALATQAMQAQQNIWSGRSTVRSLKCGRTFEIKESMLDVLDEMRTAPASRETSSSKAFLVLGVQHYGINNLPDTLARRVAAQLDNTDHETTDDASRQSLLSAARRSGYANRFQAIRKQVIWRPTLADETGARLDPKPIMQGAQSAIVVGPDGATSPTGSDEIHTDALGRIRVRFHWQRGEEPGELHSCWIRCVQQQAGARQGSQFIPRIGQEVLVAFLGGDCDRPVVIGSAYNGTGEGGIAPTPGGRAGATDLSVFEQATDHWPSGQANIAGGGTSPAWHGAAASYSQHKNNAALSGYKSREFGGPGSNQLLFDDTDGQQAIQFASTHAHSQLNMGHLIHRADNYRGSFRGAGLELRTDAYGAIRGERGLLLSTFPIDAAEPIGECTRPASLVDQASRQAAACCDMADTHLTTRLAASRGSGALNASTINPEAAPLAALLQSIKGLVPAESPAGKETVPHFADPILAIASRAGIGIVCGQDAHLHAGETLSQISQQNHELAGGEQLRIHSGQSIGLLAGAEGRGDGLRLIAGQGDVVILAQADALALQSADTLTLVSANGEADFAAAESIQLATSAGASVTLRDGQITVSCPGTMTINAGEKAFAGPARFDRRPAQFPESEFCLPCFLKAASSGSPLVPA